MEILIYLELNRRFGGGYPISHLAGVNFPKILIALFSDTLKACDYAKHQEYNAGVIMAKDIIVLNVQAANKIPAVTAIELTS